MSKQPKMSVPYLESQDINPDGSLKPYVGRGKPVIVMVQGNFCPHCTTSKPAFQELAQSPDIVAVTVQTDGDEAERQVSKALSVVNNSPGVPAFLGFGRDGRFKALHQGNRDVGSLKAFVMQL